jgi:hypothetical protein
MGVNILHSPHVKCVLVRLDNKRTAHTDFAIKILKHIDSRFGWHFKRTEMLNAEAGRTCRNTGVANNRLTAHNLYQKLRGVRSNELNAKRKQKPKTASQLIKI